MNKGDKHYTVTEETTLLPFLLGQMPGQGRNAVKGLLTREQVAVDGVTRRRFDEVLRPGQTVTIAAAAKMPPPFPILFEDDALLVCNKPPGLLTVGTGKEIEDTAFRQLTAYLKACRSRERLFVVHRLDRDTSGLLMFAKNPKLRDDMQENWDNLAHVRGYTAVVEGAPAPSAGTMRNYLHENQQHVVFSSQKAEGGRLAVTHYERLKIAGDYSLMRLRLETGRKNQIRVHMADLGCPVAGDKRYGAKTGGRLCLHADRLEFTRPDTGERLRFSLELPRQFAALLRRGENGGEHKDRKNDSGRKKQKFIRKGD